MGGWVGERGNGADHLSPGCLPVSSPPQRSGTKPAAALKAACCPLNPGRGPVSVDNAGRNNGPFQESFSPLTH